MSNHLKWLILAAEYLEELSRETATVGPAVTHTFEHGYACAQQPPPPPRITLGKSYGHNRRKKLASSRLSGSNRSSHNELEKNRRAHMRHCFEQLKEVVPLGREAARHTTQGLLTSACQLIAALGSNFSANLTLMDNLRRKQLLLEERISRVSCRSPPTLDSSSSSVSRVSYCRSDSETSSESGGSYSTGSPTFETEQIDVVGEYTMVASGSNNINNNSSHIDSGLVNGSTKRSKAIRVNGSAKRSKAIRNLSYGKGKKRALSGGESGSDGDDMRSVVSVDSGCGLSPGRKLLLVDGL